MSDEDIPRALRMEVVCVYVKVDAITAERLRSNPAQYVISPGTTDRERAEASRNRINDRTREILARSPPTLEYYRNMEVTKSVTSGDNNCHSHETPENKHMTAEEWRAWNDSRRKR